MDNLTTLTESQTWELAPSAHEPEYARFGFIAVFRRPQGTGSAPVKDPNGSEKSSEKVRRNYGESAEKVYREITLNLFIKSHEIAVKTGLSQRSVEAQISKLKSVGLLVRIGPTDGSSKPSVHQRPSGPLIADKGGHWEIIKKKKKENEKKKANVN